MPANILTTMRLCAGLKTKLVALAHPTIEGAKLFEVVEYHEDKNLAEAFEELLILKKRVCLIVPAGDRFEQRKEGKGVHVDRFTSVDLVFSDQNYLKGGNEAAVGGEKNVGVIPMADLVIAAFAEDPQLGGLPWCLLVPTDGAALTIGADDAKKLPGRQAFVLNYETASGELSLPNTTAWTN